MRIRLLTFALVALAGTALLTAACGDDDDDSGGTSTATTAASSSPAAKDVTVTAEDFSFDMSSITAAPGQVINLTLKNDGSAKHSFTVGTSDVTEAAGGAEGSGSFTASASTTEFHCKYHSQMKGTITISEGSSQDLSSPTKAPAGAGIGGYGY